MKKEKVAVDVNNIFQGWMCHNCDDFDIALPVIYSIKYGVPSCSKCKHAMGMMGDAYKWEPDLHDMAIELVKLWNEDELVKYAVYHMEIWLKSSDEAVLCEQENLLEGEE